MRNVITFPNIPNFKGGLPTNLNHDIQLNMFQAIIRPYNKIRQNLIVNLNTTIRHLYIHALNCRFLFDKNKGQYCFTRRYVDLIQTVYLPTVNFNFGCSSFLETLC